MSSPSPFFALLADDKALEAGHAAGVAIGIALIGLMCLAVPAFLILSIVKYVRTRTRGWLTAMIVSGSLCLIPMGVVTVAFCIGVYRGIKESRDGSRPIAADQTVESSDGAVKLRAAEHWRFLSDLNEDAVLQVGNPARDEFLIILTDSKEDYAGTLEEFAATTSESIAENLEDAVATELKKITLNGHEAFRCEISGTMDTINIDYHFTAVESTNGYHQIMAWTTRSKKQAAFQVFSDVVETCELR